MKAHGDTIFNEFTVKNELSDDEFNQEELGLQIAFGTFEYSYLASTKTDSLVKVDYENYIEYKVGLWTVTPSAYGHTYVMDEQLGTHACNETDLNYFSKNYDYIEDELMKKKWGTYVCLDNPEKLKLRQGAQYGDRKSLFIEAYYNCSGSSNGNKGNQQLAPLGLSDFSSDDCLARN